MADATGSGKLTEAVELGAVWAAIPDLVEPMHQMPNLDVAWRRPLLAFDPHWNPDQYFVSRMSNVLCRGVMSDGLPADAVRQVYLDELAHYPAVADAVARVDPHLGPVDSAEAVMREWSPLGRVVPVVPVAGVTR